jgi:hypothetical protein
MHEKTNLELQVICEQNGLSNKGGKLELIARLEAAGVKELRAEKPEKKAERRGRPKKNK